MRQALAVTERARPLKIKEFPFQIINEVNTMALDAATLALTAAELKATQMCIRDSFMPAGNYLGQVLAGQSFRWIIIPIGMLIG